MAIYNHGIKSRQCSRCGLQINYKETKCPHCFNLSDTDALKLKKLYKSELLKINADLGKTFKYLFLITLCLMLLLYLV